MSSYTNIWLSSVDHLNQFASIASTKDKQVWKVSQIPKVRALFGYVPVVFYSKGRLEIGDSGLHYSAEVPKGNILKSYKYLQNDLKMVLPYGEVEEISRYKHPNPLFNYYNTNWISIKYSQRELLLAQGGNGPSMRKIVNETNKIYEELSAHLKVATEELN